ncbi:CBASS cGAMP-activated phospholipase [Christiangramia sp. ASW11-125]|uniref:CBASS cGAMP-activated phospholipase n=1 Tax=Christiangramia TaxID=292691 RepID=UPI0004202BDA|nr:CBASS cGAMP-activated phospholipase [Christiangramia portivictoriae]
MDTGNQKKKNFKILSIDGGGIKGLYSATILREFESKFNCHISDHFDMICGTSTGGLIALGLSLKIPARDLVEFYKKEGPKIFPESKNYNFFGKKVSRRFLSQIIGTGKYSDKPLRKALENIFGEHTIGDSHNLLCIPTYTVTEARPFVFKYDHPEGDLDRDNECKMVDVALATSAAPTYFPMVDIPLYNNKQFVDGGVWSNNPTLTGLLEALDYFVGEGFDKKNLPKKYDSVKILSLSSLTLTDGKPTRMKRERSFYHWGNDLFETSLTGQSFFTDFFMSKLQKLPDLNIEYNRIPSFKVSSQQESLVQLDVATPDALDLMEGKGKDQADIYKKTEEIKAYFETEKSYKTKVDGQL